MSAELYDAEMAGAMARPAIDVLPTNTRKGKAEGHVPEAAPEPVLEAAPVEVAPAPAETELGVPDFGGAASGAPDVAADFGAPVAEAPVAEAFAAPSDLAEPAAPAVDLAPDAEAPAPRKVFGMALTRTRKPKAAKEPVAEAVVAEAEIVEDPTTVNAPELEAPVLEAADAAPEPTGEVLAEAPATEIVALAPSMPDHTEEVRAMRALLEASEQVRQAAEARTAAAEAQLRTVTNTVQEWQIRHREAESTITELAASLAGAEGRMGELHQQLSAAQAERDELTAQLDAATSPATS